MRHRIDALGGYDLELPEGDHITREVARHVPYESQLLELAAAVARDGLVVDVGAHAGNHTVYLAKAGARVVAFEPNAAIGRFLELNIASNALAGRVTVHPVGLWNERSSGRVQPGPAGNTGSTALSEDVAGDIELVPLDSFELAPDVVKIDVEGAEMQVLEGAAATLAAHRPAVFVEAHQALDEVAGFLSRLGYRRLGRSWAVSPTYLFAARGSHFRRAAPFVARQFRTRVQRGLRRRASRLPGLSRAYRGLLHLRWSATDAVGVARLRVPSRRAVATGDSPDVVVSMTSFPARIDDAWIAVEAMLRQDHAPERVVLVLSDEEFPTREIPQKLVEQKRRGLEVLWTPRNNGCFNKLIPTRLAYPDATIVTVDDDMLYRPWLVSRLVADARQHPGTVVGHRGWEVQLGPGGLTPYVDWPGASCSSPTDRVLLTGVGGVLYPPDALPIELLTDLDLALTLTPHNDDIWFWAVARVAGTPVRCLALTSGRPLRRHSRTPMLNTVNVAAGQNDAQLASVIEHFRLPVSRSGSSVA